MVTTVIPEDVRGNSQASELFAVYYNLYSPDRSQAVMPF